MMKLTMLFLFYCFNLLIFKSFKNTKFWLNKIQLFNQNMMCMIMITYIIMFLNMKKNYWNSTSINMGYDYLSWSLIALTFWVTTLMMMTINSMSLNKLKLMNWIMLMNFMIMMSFLMMNMFLFYLFFEISLIPIIILIMGWGAFEDRISASFYMLMYTLMASLPLLLVLFYLYYTNASLYYPILLYQMNYFNSSILFSLTLMSFFVKMPMYLIHMWLPKAHVEASVIGSMILAAVLLKLGSYGLYRFLIIMKLITLKNNFIYISINLIGSLNLSLICLNQIDMKMIVAYSSIVHMSMLIMSNFTMFKMGLDGAIYLMIAHGLCSSSMFMMVNFMYLKSQSRSIFINKGLITIMPMMTSWWFMMCICNMAAPPSVNLFSEILMLSSMIMWNKTLIIYLMMICLYSATYSLFLFSITQHGKIHYNLNYTFKNNNKEFLLILFHWIPINTMILNFMIS